jgi:tyrosine-protein kinase Etk/Wzc
MDGKQSTHLQAEPTQADGSKVVEPMQLGTNPLEQVPPLTGDGAGDEVNLLDVLIVLAKRKRVIGRITAGATLLAVIISLLLPNTYTAITRILPPQPPQSSAAAMLVSQLNPFGLGLGKDLGLKSPSDLYVALLRSRFVADDLIQHFDLKKVYGDKTSLDARNTLADRSDFKATKEGVLEISVDDREPKRAAAIANAYVDELQKLTQSLAVSEASQRRLFYEHELVAANDNLRDAEVELKKTQEKTGLIQLDAQAKAIIESAATLRAQIAAKEIQLQRMRLFATEENPDLRGAERELSALQGQLAIVERKGVGGDGDIQVATAKVPAAGLEYIRRLRAVKYSEAVFELLTKQFEAAKLDEANSAVIQVIDKAIEPERKSKPKRMLIVIISAFASFFLAALWALIQEYYERLRSDPEGAARLHLFRAYLLGKGAVQP